MKDHMEKIVSALDRRVIPPKRVTSPTQGPPTTTKTGPQNALSPLQSFNEALERFSYGLEMKTCEQNRNKNKPTYSDLIGFSNGHDMPENFLEINRYFLFDVILQQDWLIEQCLLRIRVFFGGKTQSPCFDLFINWLIKQITNTLRHQFSRSDENQSIGFPLRKQ